MTALKNEGLRGLYRATEALVSCATNDDWCRSGIAAPKLKQAKVSRGLGFLSQGPNKVADMPACPPRMLQVRPHLTHASAHPRPSSGCTSESFAPRLLSVKALAPSCALPPRRALSLSLLSSLFSSWLNPMGRGFPLHNVGTTPQARTPAW
eukprot:1062618-Rhodomonas_salina.1